jgi:hypothetical protein
VDTASDTDQESAVEHGEGEEDGLSRGTKNLGQMELVVPLLLGVFV